MKYTGIQIQQGGAKMKLTVVGRQMTVDKRLKSQAAKKLSRLDKYFLKEGEATVAFTWKRNKANIEVTINAANTLFRSEVDEETFLNALDRAVEAIERQIHKNKTRLEKRLREGVFDHSYPEDVQLEEDPGFIIRTKTFKFKPMSPEEAILQMNLLGHQFFVFEDQDTGDTCVVYSRRDGAYGLIVPEH